MTNFITVCWEGEELIYKMGIDIKRDNLVLRLSRLIITTKVCLCISLLLVGVPA